MPILPSPAIDRKNLEGSIFAWLVGRLVVCHPGNSSDVTLAFEDALDDTDNSDDTDDTDDPDDTDDTNDTESKVSTVSTGSTLRTESTEST